MQASLDFVHQPFQTQVLYGKNHCDSPQESSGNDPSPRLGDPDEDGQDLEDENDDSDAGNRHGDSRDARPRKPHLQVQAEHSSVLGSSVLL